MKYISLFLTLLIFSGCASLEKKIQKSKDLLLAHPTELAEICHDRFPTIPQLIKGEPIYIPGKTIYIKGDSIPCPDGSFVKSPDKSVDCPPQQVRVDTLIKPDAAKEFLLQRKIDSLYAVNDALREQNKKLVDDNTILNKSLTETLKTSQTRLIIIIGMGIVIAILAFLVIKGKVKIF